MVKEDLDVPATWAIAMVVAWVPENDRPLIIMALTY